MVRRINIRAMGAIARAEYIRWVTNPRMIILAVFVVFMRSLTVEPLLEHAAKMGMPINVLEPFIAAGNSSFLALMLPLLFLVLISDYPILAENTLFVVHRVGRMNWFLGQFLFLLMADISFLGALLIASILISGGTFGTDWSDVVTKYLSVYPAEEMSFASNLLPSNLYNQLTLGQALLHTLLLLGANLLLMALILYVFKLMGRRVLGIMVDILLMAGGIAAWSLGLDWMWGFPMANTLVWAHYTKILREPVYPVENSYIYFGIFITVVLICCILLLKKVRFLGDVK